MTDSTTDVLIIGGGFCGCSAAMSLHEAGVDFQLLEAASGHLGGRAFSFPWSPSGTDGVTYHFEHGAQFVGVEQPSIMKLIHEHVPEYLVDGYEARLAWRDQVMVLDEQRFVYDRDDCLFGIGGVPPDMDIWNVVGSLLLIMELEMYEQSIDVVDPGGSPVFVKAWDAVTLDEWISRPWVPPLAASLMRVSVQALLSVQAKEVSAYYFFWYCACNGGFLNEVNDEKGGPQQYYLSCGMDELLERWTAPIRERIHMATRVKSIEHGAEGATVKTYDGTTWKAKKLILAMSPPTSQRMDIQPALPAARQALMQMHMGRTIKCVLFYRSPWWRDSHTEKYTGYAGAESSPVIWVMDYTPPENNDGNCYPLMTFTVAAQADELFPNPSIEKLAEYVTEAVAFLFNDERALHTSDEFLDIIAYGWGPEEAIAGGGPNMVLPPKSLVPPRAPGRSLNTPEGSLFFASSEAARKLDPVVGPKYANGKYPDARQSLGYMDGGIVAGEFVAAQVQAALEGKPVPAGSPDADSSTATSVLDEIVGNLEFASLLTVGGEALPMMPPAKVEEVLGALCNNMYASAAIDLDGWKAGGWTQDPEALQAEVTALLVKSLQDVDLLPGSFDPTKPADELLLLVVAARLVRAGWHDTSLEVDDAAKDPHVVAIQALVPVVNALMRLISAEPTSKDAHTGATKTHGRFSSLRGLLRRVFAGS